MDVAAARDLLGVGPGTTADALRHAYRAALRRSHPDLGGRDEAVHEVVAAYELLVAASSPAGAGGTGSDGAAEGGLVSSAVTVAGDTVAAELPAGDLFAMLVDVGHRLGEVAYVDDLAGILEVVVDVAGYGACSVVLTLQGRGTGATEAFCTVEALGAGPAPPADAVAELLAVGLRTVADA